MIESYIGIKLEPTVHGQTKFQFSNNCRLLILLCKFGDFLSYLRD